MNNIFLMGKAGSGKDSVSEILMCWGYEPYALADPIRQEYRRFFPGKDSKKDRDKMIDMGQAYKALFGETVWVKLIHDSILKDGTQLACITDGRYAIEYEYFVNQLGYIPVRVVCSDAIRLERLRDRDGSAQEAALKKESTELDEMFAHTIVNESTLDDLMENTREVFRGILL